MAFAFLTNPYVCLSFSSSSLNLWEGDCQIKRRKRRKDWTTAAKRKFAGPVSSLLWLEIDQKREAPCITSAIKRKWKQRPEINKIIFATQENKESLNFSRTGLKMYISDQAERQLRERQLEIASERVAWKKKQSFVKTFSALFEGWYNLHSYTSTCLQNNHPFDSCQQDGDDYQSLIQTNVYHA